MSNDFLPRVLKDAFYCPRCSVLVPQKWFKITKPHTNVVDIVAEEVPEKEITTRNFAALIHGSVESKYQYEWDLLISVCTRCKNYTIWENSNIIFPYDTGLSEPHEDMPEEVKGIYYEAMHVFKHSPRASAALLRLAIETMIPQLEEYEIKKAKINTMIGELVKKNIPEHIQQGLDAIRIYGNEGIHPGEIILNDNQETVLFLFDLINIMVEELITRRKKIRSFYERLPFDKIEGIMKRDKVKTGD